MRKWMGWSFWDNFRIYLQQSWVRLCVSPSCFIFHALLLSLRTCPEYKSQNEKDMTTSDLCIFHVRAPKGAVCFSSIVIHARWSWIWWAIWMSSSMILTHFARVGDFQTDQQGQASLASWGAITAELWRHISVLKSWAISRTRRWKGSLRISGLMDF